MSNISIALAALVVWLGLGIVFLSMCKAASRVDRDSEKMAGAAAAPRTFRQHVFAVHARSLRSMRRLAGGRGTAVRTAPVRDHLGHPLAGQPGHSAGPAQSA